MIIVYRIIPPILNISIISFHCFIVKEIVEKVILFLTYFKDFLRDDPIKLCIDAGRNRT